MQQHWSYITAPDMIDITDADVVEIMCGDKQTVWVNVNGTCKLRVQGYKTLLATLNTDAEAHAGNRQQSTQDVRKTDK